MNKVNKSRIISVISIAFVSLHNGTSQSKLAHIHICQTPSVDARPTCRSGLNDDFLHLAIKKRRVID